MSTRLMSFPSCVCAIILAAAISPIACTQQATSEQTASQVQALQKKLSSAPATSHPLTAAEINLLLASVTEQAKQQAAALQPPPVMAPKPKKSRVGIVMPQADLGPGYSGDKIGEPLRGMIAHYLGGPMMELVSLDSLVSQQIDAEAQAKQCDFILYTSASQKKTGGNGMSLFKGATTVANLMPMVQVAKMTGGMMAAAGSAASAASATQEAVALSKGVKAKSEVSLEYRLQAPGNPTPIAHDVFSQKASSDGDDVLTPLIGKLAEAVATQVAK